MDGYRLFRRDRQDRQGGGLALYVREGLDCMALTVGDDTIERLWVRIKEERKRSGCCCGSLLSTTQPG